MPDEPWMPISQQILVYVQEQASSPCERQLFFGHRCGEDNEEQCPTCRSRRMLGIVQTVVPDAEPLVVLRPQVQRALDVYANLTHVAREVVNIHTLHRRTLDPIRCRVCRVEWSVAGCHLPQCWVGQLVTVLSSLDTVNEQREETDGPRSSDSAGSGRPRWTNGQSRPPLHPAPAASDDESSADDGRGEDGGGPS